jgi:hypothetical protein
MPWRADAWRLALLALVGPILAGCASPDEGPAAPAVAEPMLVAVPPRVLVDGTFQWHETSGSNAMEYYDLASQAVAHPCVWDGGGSGEEPYFNNRELPVEDAGLGAWSGNVSFTLSWTDADWTGTALRVAYQAPGLRGWEETRAIERGGSLVEAIRVPARNATAGERDDAATGWQVWVCLPTESLEPAQPFVGSVTAQVVFTPDPVPDSELGPDEAAEGRTARDGLVPAAPAAKA